jgi:hypothetical protein
MKPDRETERLRSALQPPHAALNGVLSQLFTAVTLQRQPETLAGVRTWNEFPCEYFFFIESPQPQ